MKLTTTLTRDQCDVHGGLISEEGGCQTWRVLREVSMERARQFDRYGTNEDTPDGTGPETRWLAGYVDLPTTYPSAVEIEAEFRADYEEFEQETGHVTWVHLLREELAEAFVETDPTKLREELLQLAALSVSWIEKLDARAVTEKAS